MDRLEEVLPPDAFIMISLVKSSTAAIAAESEERGVKVGSDVDTSSSSSVDFKDMRVRVVLEVESKDDEGTNSALVLPVVLNSAVDVFSSLLSSLLLLLFPRFLLS